MATGIQYLDETWNPITGCTPISEGCANCWAKTMANRLKGMGSKRYQHDDPFAVRFHPDELDKPLHWRKPRRVGVCFMGDMFHDDVPWQAIEHVYSTISRLQVRHQFFCLTKRPARMAERYADWCRHASGGNPMPAIWNGITAENNIRFDERVGSLFRAGGKMWASLEPMLSGIYPGQNTLKQFGWVVVGCESGPKRRPCKLEWIQDIVEQCKAAGVPCFVKQVPVPKVPMEAREASTAKYMPANQYDAYCERHGWRVSHDPFEWPESLRVQEFPT